jgi:hypothetical protein
MQKGTTGSKKLNFLKGQAFFAQTNTASQHNFI